MILSTKELDKILGDQNLLLIDTRSFKEYSEGHIEEAVHLDLFSFHWIDTSKQGIESFNTQILKFFSSVGISDERKIVFYDDVSGMLAARGVWLLMYFSHPQVFMLDGGFEKWKAENLSIEKKLNAPQPGNFSGRINPNLITGFEYILENLDRLKIIDARTTEEFEGTSVRALQKGHIPNAINIDWKLNIDLDGTMKNNEKLVELYQLPKDAEIVTYCQGAYRAANTFLALKKIGFKNVRVYLGSWGEWGNKLDLPVSLK